MADPKQNCAKAPSRSTLHLLVSQQTPHIQEPSQSPGTPSAWSGLPVHWQVSPLLPHLRYWHLCTCLLMMSFAWSAVPACCLLNAEQHLLSRLPQVHTSVWPTGGGILFAAFSLPFWLAGFSLGRSAVGKSLIKEGLNIGPKSFELSQSLPLLGKKAGEWVVPKGIKGRSKDLIGAKIVGNSVVNGALQTHIELHEGVRTHIFGEGLKAAEQQWLVRAINSHLTQQGCKVAPDFSDKMPQGFNVVREQGFYDSGFRNNMLDNWADDD